MVAGAVDELAERGKVASADEVRTEGAACAVLAADDAGGVEERFSVHLAGWGLAGAGMVADAIELAAPTGVPEDAIVFRGDDTTAGATGAAFAFADAVLALRAGAAHAALVTCNGGRSLASALLLTS